MTHVTCRLTAKNQHQLWYTMFKYLATFTFVQTYTVPITEPVVGEWQVACLTVVDQSISTFTHRLATTHHIH